jgi:hypothetical protein
MPLIYIIALFPANIQLCDIVQESLSWINRVHYSFASVHMWLFCHFSIIIEDRASLVHLRHKRRRKSVFTMHDEIVTENEEYSTDLRPAWGWPGVGFAILTALIGGIIATFGIQALSLLAGQELQPDTASPAGFILTMLVYLSLLLGIYLFAARKAGWAAVGLVPVPNKTLLLVPLLLVLVLTGMIVINLSLAYLSGGTFENPQVEALTGGSALSPLTLVLLLLLVAVVVPIVEELFFRGMIYPLLRYRWGAGIAIGTSAAIFAVFHFVPLLMPALFFVGLILGYLREQSGSVLPGVLLHAMQNAIALLAFQAALSAPA